MSEDTRQGEDVEVVRENILRHLRRLGLSPRGASLQAGMSADAIRMILNGRSNAPRGTTLSALADLFGVSIDDLMRDDGSARNAGHEGRARSGPGASIRFVSPGVVRLTMDADITMEKAMQILALASEGAQ